MTDLSSLASLSLDPSAHSNRRGVASTMQYADDDNGIRKRPIAYEPQKVTLNPGPNCSRAGAARGKCRTGSNAASIDARNRVATNSVASAAM